jgi:dihydrolipoamide dehydrogenase
MESYDLVVIGGGPAGYVGAIRAAQLGANVCVVEKDELGGVCLNRGCIPTKTLVKTAELLARMREAEAFGLTIPGPVSLDLPKAMARKDQVVKTLVKGIESLFKGWKITIKKGDAKFVSREKLIIQSPAGVEEIGARATLVATGSSAAQIPMFPVDGQIILSSDHLLKMQSVPKSILIIGAGAIGCEWAFIMKEFGSEVTVIEMLPQVAPTEDEMVGTLLLREMKKRKIKALTGEKIVKVETSSEGVIAHTESREQLRAEKMLVSIGRSPNSRELGLEQIGGDMDSRGFIKVNSRLETSVPGIYAAGDVVGGMLLAHKASAEAKVAVANALGRQEEMDYRVIPAVIFTFPEVGSVGLKERDAQAQGLNYAASSFPFRALGKAQAIGEIAGEVKLVFEKDSLRLLGCHIIGPDAGDLIHEAALALRLNATIKDLAETVHAHPTLSEAMMEAGEAALGQAIHLPKPKTP